MDRLTPPYKPEARLSTERQAWRQSERARSGFGTYLLMRRFPHRLLGIRRESYRSENLRSGYLFIKILEICIKRTCLSCFMPTEVFLCDRFSRLFNRRTKFFVLVRLRKVYRIFSR